MVNNSIKGIHGAIGKVLENRIQEALPHLVKNPDGSNMPDFSWNNIHLEAKNGFKDWGPKPHSFQFSNLICPPNFYVLGYHDFANSLELTKKGNYKTWFKKLNKDMNFNQIIFTSPNIVEEIFNLMVPDNRKEVHNYGRIRPSIINAIFNEGSFHIHKKKYYGSDLIKEDYFLQKPDSFPFFNYDLGFIVKKEDKELLDKVLWGPEIGLPCYETIEDWIENGCAEFFEMFEYDLKDVKKVFKYEKSSDEIFIGDYRDPFNGEYNELLGCDRGPIALSMLIKNMGALPLNSCSGHYGQAYIGFAADKKEAHDIWKMTKDTGLSFERAEIYGYPCYGLVYDCKDHQEGAAKMIEVSEKILQNFI